MHELDTAAVHQLLAADLHRWMRRRVRTPEEADDLVQDVFVRIHRELPGLRDPGRLGPWVMRIARSVLVDRARRSRPHEPLEEPAVAPDPVETDPTEIVAGWLPAFVAQLPETTREAVRLSELEGLSQTEVARRLGLSPSGARSRVQRGRRQLRDLLEACCTIEREGADVLQWRRRGGCDAGC